MWLAWALLAATVGSAMFVERKSASFYDANGVYHAGCHSRQPSWGPESNFSLPVVLTQTQKLVKTVANGKLYTALLPNANPGWRNSSQTVFVTHLWGSAYEMGVAQGQLLGPVLVEFVDAMWATLDREVASVLKALPAWLASLVADLGLDAALDATELITRSYTKPGIYDELKGIATASGVDYQRLVRVHMLAGLTQGACSTVGLWGAALSPHSATQTLQLRALDWNMDAPFRKFAAITVYHPNPGDGNQFALVGFPGFVGALSGMSDKKLAISEIGVSYPDPSFGKMSRVGLPFIFLLREILQYDVTVDDATSRMATAHRTCDLILGVGDGKLGEVRGYQYSYSQLRVIDDENLIPKNDTWHAPIANAIYFGMDWICPTFNTVLGAQLRKYYGQITPQIARQNVSAVEMSGDNHLVWYDLTNALMWASFAAPPGADGPQEAYWREYLEVDLRAAFAEPRPAKRAK